MDRGKEYSLNKLSELAEDLEIEQIDVIKAFLNSLANTDIYVKVPPDWEIDKKVLQDAPK
jgi:hypothetical protein